MKKSIGIFLIFVLLISLMPVTVLAQASEQYPIASTLPELLGGINTPGSIALAEGHYTSYLDRLADLPDYAFSFYSWLEDNANASGALANPTLGENFDGNYYHVVTHISGSRTVSFKSGQNIESLAGEVATEAVDEELTIFGQYAGAVYDTFDRDHPEVFWLNGKSTYSALGDYYYSYQGNTCTVYYELDMVFWLTFGSFDLRSPDYRSPQAVAKGIALRDAAVKEILSGCTAETPFEQLRYLNKAMTTRNAYNRAGGEGRWSDADAEAWECISALTGRAGDQGPVCEGYARAFMVLCQQLGIPCVLVDGPAKEALFGATEAHMWNYVFLDGGWYAVDVTWNDPFVSNQPEKKCSGFESEEWMLLGSDTQVASGLNFLQSHVVENDIGGDGLCYTNGPVLSPKTYDPQSVKVYSIQGTITGLGDPEIPMTVELCQVDGARCLKTLTLTGEQAAYQLENLLPGTYVLIISKEGYVSRELTVTLTDANMKLDAKLQKVGDMSGDGEINIGDVGKLYAHIRGVSVIEDPYLLECADVNGDGEVNVADTGRLYFLVKN